MWLTGQMPQMRDVMPGISLERAALAELLEAAELGDVEVRVGRPCPRRPGWMRDLGVALDAGDGVDDDALAHGAFL